jgi:hypothetical protein
MLHDIFLRLRKSNEVTVFRKEFNELLVILFYLGVTVPLQFLVNAF